MTTSPTHKAFTLVEVMIALGVVVFAFVAILGTLPIGLNTNQDSLERTAAAMLTSSIMADLRDTAVAVPAVDETSPRFQVPLPATGATTCTLFFGEDGNPTGAINANADPTQSPRYRATFFITAPNATSQTTGQNAPPPQKTATAVRILITWPALADPQAAVLPAKYRGSYEITAALNRD